MEVLWTVSLSSATESCNAAATAHQIVYDANQQWLCSCSQDNSLTWHVHEWLQQLDRCSQYAEPELEKLLTTDMTAWKRKLLLEQMGFADQQNNVSVNDFENAYNDMATVSAKALELATIVQALLRSELPCINPDWKTEALNKCQHIIQFIHGQIRKQLSKALVVIEQPPNPLKQAKIFDTSVRLLSCGPFLENANNNVEVHVESFENAHKMCESENTLENKTAPLAVEENDSKKIIAQFSKMKITSIEDRKKKKNWQRRAGRISKKNEVIKKKVVEKSFVLRYDISNSSYGDIENIEIQTYSEPFFYYLHANQECFATALAFWKSVLLLADAQGNSDDFHISWPFFEIALSSFFKKTLGTDRCLLPVHLKNIGSKLFGHIPSAEDKVSFNKMAKQELPKMKKITFWEWFYKAMHLIKTKPVLNVWNNGWFFGFISRSEAKDILCSYPDSSFLFRISETRLGAMSLVAWKPQQDKIEHLDPFNAEDLVKIPLKTIECQEMQSVMHLISLERTSIPKVNVLDALKREAGMNEVSDSEESYVYRTWRHLSSLF
uniref:SH2 domain-containing protein n=1 Tax=Plectus sambesii TaxID=2011161 RepID=A0A914WNA3_9BILA